MLLKSDLKKEQKDKLFEDVKKLIGDVSGDKTEARGEKKLSYPIKRQRSGEFVILNFDADKVDPEFNKRIGIKEEILRHLLVRS